MFVGFDVDRCMEAAGVLFSTTETKMLGRMRLLKLLYLANRKSLKETGDPIVDDDAFAMKDGPVLSHTYDLIKGTEKNKESQSAWSAHFKVVDSIQIQMLSDPGTDHLSDYDVEALEEIARLYKDAEDYDLSELTHKFDEYKKSWGDGTRKSAPIAEDDLLTGIGYSPEEIKVALGEAKSYATEHDLLGCR
jgi:uncharacterized phage-associated protein